MANVKIPSGFVPVNLRSRNRYVIKQADLATYRLYDVVRSAGDADAVGTCAVTLASGSEPVRGSIIAIEPAAISNGLMSLPIPSTKKRDYYVWVADDPAQVFSARDDAAVPANLVPAYVGRLCDFLPNQSATPVNDLSTAWLSSASFGSGSICQVLGLDPNLKSTFAGGAAWLVGFAQHELAASRGGGAGSGATRFVDLTDRATANLPAINAPLAAAIAAVRTTIVDNLTTADATEALSANQGVVLEGQINALVTQFQQLVGGSNGITLGNDFVTTPEDTPITGNVLTNDTTVSGTLSVTQYVVVGVVGVFLAGDTTPIPSVGSITLAANGAFTFTPVANWNGTAPTVTYQVTNGVGGIAQANLIVTVTPVNDAPVATADNSATLQGQPVTISVLANDTDIENDALSITQLNAQAVVVGVPLTISSGTVVLNSDKTVTYTPSALITGPQSFTYTVDDGNGGSAVGNVTVTVVPTGGSVATPFVEYLDTLFVPTGNSGENGLGGALSIFGTNFGVAADLGSLTKVYIGGIEVANYRYLGASKVFTKNGRQQITVQVGKLTALPFGTPQPVTVVRNGTATSNNDVTVTPLASRVLFASLAGHDNTAVPNDIAHPWRHLQTKDGVTNQSNGGIALVVLPGDQVQILGGHWTDTTGIDGCWIRFTGSAMTQQGTAAAPIHFTAYPGAIGANAIDDAHFTAQAGMKGGIQGPNSAYHATTGNYITVSNLRMDCDANAQSDAAPINMQYAFHSWRAVNNELGPWPAAIVALAGGISGHAQNSQFLGNYIHDMGCTGASTNHGIYADSGALNWDIGWNWISNITGGNLIQLFDQLGLAAGDQSNMPTGWKGFEGFKVHHNWCEICIKYGLNWQSGVIGVDTFNNVIIGSTFAGVRLELGYPQKAWALNFENNTFYNCDQVGSGSGNNQVLNDNWNTPVGGKIRFGYNIFAAGPLTLAASGLPNPAGSIPTYWSFDYNVFSPYQGAQSWTSFSPDAHAIFTPILFTSPSTGDFSLQATSPAIDAAGGTPFLTITNDFLGTPRPQGSAFDLGAFERVNNKPYSITPPTFAGTYKSGLASNVGTGVWGNFPTGYTYQWFTAAVANGTPNPISGATTNAYTWQLTDQGLYGGCTVTATNANGSTSKDFYVGGVVGANPSAPVNTVQPSITGTGGIGNVLTRVAGTWTPNSGANAAVVTWVWRRNGTPISGATGATYTQQSADDSAVIDLLETGTNSFGFSTAASSNTITVPHVPVAPGIVGTPTAFDSTSGTVSLAVLVGDYVNLGFSANNNNVYNLTLSDNLGGSSTDWVDNSSGSSGSVAGGIRTRKMTQAGTLTVTLGTDGGATYAGLAWVVRGVATTRDDGAVVTHGATTSPATGTPSTTTNAKDLLCEFIATLSSNWCTVGAESDTAVASNDKTSGALLRQATLQTRTTSTAGAQAAMTAALSGGGSGTDIHSFAVIINYKGA